MNERKKISKKKLKKDHRRETITLDGFFGNKWRILKGENTYILLLYGKHRRTSQHFKDFLQLLGILKGIHLGRTLDDSFINRREIYNEQKAEEKRENSLLYPII